MIIPGSLRPALAVAAGLILVIVAEMTTLDVGGRAPSVPALDVTPPGRLAPPFPENALETILGRPLFQSDRRLRTGDTVVRDDGKLPRLTGIVVAPERKVAVFQPFGEKPKALKEGDAIGGWTIRTIDRRQVVLERNGGTMTIEPVKDSTIAGSAIGATPQGTTRFDPIPSHSRESSGRTGEP